MKTLTCPCCGHLSIGGQYDICGYCAWEHIAARELLPLDHEQGWPLVKAQRHYKDHGVSQPGLEVSGEPAGAVLDLEWMPLDRYNPESIEILLGAREGDRERVAHALENGADVEASFHHGYYHGRTPLIWAAGGSLELINYLLARGANPNARGKHSETALVIAVRGAQLENVETLIRAGADPNLADASGVTPLSVLDAEYFLTARKNLDPHTDAGKTVSELRDALRQPS